MPTVSGSVKDAGYAVGGRVVRAYRRDTGALLAQAISSTGVAALGDTNYPNVSLSIHGDGADGSTSLTDHSSSAKTLSMVGGAVLSTAVKKFGAASVRIPSGGEIYLPTATDLILDGDFTVEMWVNRDSTAATVFLGGLYPAFNNQIQFEPTQLFIYSGPSLRIPFLTSFVGVWTHLAISRVGSTVYLFQDGALCGSGSYAGTLTLSGGSIGKLRGYNDQYYAGYFDDLRITKGVGRYTVPFTAPTAPHVDTASSTPAAVGAYSFDLSYSGEVQIVCLDGDDGSVQNDLITRATV